MTQNCGDCEHRSYGEQRRYTDCIKPYGFWDRVKPRPKDFGAKCKLFASRSGPPTPEHTAPPSTTRGEQQK